MNFKGICLFLAVMGGLSFPGCGNEKTDASDPTIDKLASYETYIELYASTDCDRKIRCNASAAFASVEACVQAIDPKVTRQRQRIADSVNQNRSSYDSKAAKDCLDQLNGDCAVESVTILKSCNKVIAGALPVGAACVGTFECDPLDETWSNGPWCFENCKGLFGDEEQAGSGICVAESPVATPDCK